MRYFVLGTSRFEGTPGGLIPGYVALRANPIPDRMRDGSGQESAALGLVVPHSEMYLDDLAIARLRGEHVARLAARRTAS